MALTVVDVDGWWLVVPGVDADACDRCVRAGAVEYIRPPPLPAVLQLSDHDHSLSRTENDTRCDVCGHYTEGVAYHCSSGCNWGASPSSLLLPPL